MSRKKKVVIVYDEASLDISSELELALNGKISDQVREAMQDTSTISLVEQVETISEVLIEYGYSVSTVITSSDIKQMTDKLQSEKPDLVFNFCESIEGNSFQEMNVAGLYELLNIRYTGSNPLTLGSCLDKVRTKQILSFHKIGITPFRVFVSPDEVVRKKLRFPVIAKPIHEDASIGISNSSILHDRDTLQRHLAELLKKFSQPILVEEYIEGREFNVAIVGTEELLALPVSEIDFSTMPDGYNHIVSYEAKWIPESIEYKNTVPVCPARISQRLQKKLQSTAMRAYEVMGCRDYGRVDMRVDKNGNVFVLEVNANPDLSPSGSGFARSANAFGWTYGQLINNIVESAFKRHIA